MTDKERYATIGTWVEVFRKEGANVSISLLRTRLNEAGVIGQSARNRIGHIILKGFYAESEVRGLLTDVLQNLPQADQSGFFENDGERFGLVRGLSKLLGISDNVIRSRIQNSSIKSIKGKDYRGRIFDFYPLAVVRDLCLNLTQDIPQSNAEGTFEKEGETYGTIKSLSNLLNISPPSIRARLLRSTIKPLPGKNYNGLVCDYYPLSRIQELFQDLLQDLPQAGEDSTFEKDGETYGTIGCFSKLIGISERKIVSRIQEGSLKSTKGKNMMGNICDFYSLAAIRECCQDLIQDFPEAGEDSTFEKDGETYGTVKGLSRLLSLSASTVQIRVQQAKIQSVKGKIKGGQIYDFFPLSKVQELFQDLLQNLPLAGEDSTFEKDGETYGTINKLCELLGISKNVLPGKILGSDLKPIRGRSPGGQLHDFYSLSEVQVLCADLFHDMPRAGEDGTFERDGETYGTVGSLSVRLGISGTAIEAGIKKASISPIQGKNRIGRILDFYAVSEIRKCCDYLLADLPQAGEEGTFEKGGETYGAIRGLSKLLGLSESAIQSRIEKNSIPSVPGKNQIGRVYDFYPASMVRKYCEDLLQDLPQADENGFFEIAGECYGSVRSLSRFFCISRRIIRSRIQSGSLISISGKDQGGRIQCFYSLSELQNLCADLIAKRKKD